MLIPRRNLRGAVLPFSVIVASTLNFRESAGWEGWHYAKQINLVDGFWIAAEEKLVIGDIKEGIQLSFDEFAWIILFATMLPSRRKRLEDLCRRVEVYANRLLKASTSQNLADLLRPSEWDAQKGFEGLRMTMLVKSTHNHQRAMLRGGITGWVGGIRRDNEIWLLRTLGDHIGVQGPRSLPIADEAWVATPTSIKKTTPSKEIIAYAKSFAHRVHVFADSELLNAKEAAQSVLFREEARSHKPLYSITQLDKIPEIRKRTTERAQIWFSLHRRLQQGLSSWDHDAFCWEYARMLSEGARKPSANHTLPR